MILFRKIASATIVVRLKLLAAIMLAAVSTSASGQDIHFSQFFNCPYNLNPGLTGQFNGAYRFVGNQRTQWRSVTVPYSTFGLGADAGKLELPDGILNKKDGIEYATDLNIGISFFHDKTGDSQLTSNQINLLIGKDIPVGNDNHSVVSGALAIGYTGMNIDYNALQYDNQWNGFVYDPGISSDEIFARDSRGYMNLNAGLIYRKSKSREEEFIGGIAVYNINQPRQSFFNDGYVKLDTRLNLHGSYRFEVNRDWLVEPMLMASFQGTYNALNFGGLAYYITDKRSYAWKAIYAGVLGRASDAGYVVAGMHYNEWNVGLSYDINTSNLKPASNGRGGFEIAVIYIIPPAPKPRKIKVCPDFM
jgi:type IX secretion system PorP/SprF family membrane protein